jgi:hypothetical protein
VLCRDARKNGEEAHFHGLFAGQMMITAGKLKVPLEVDIK